MGDSVIEKLQVVEKDFIFNYDSAVLKTSSHKTSFTSATPFSRYQFMNFHTRRFQCLKI